MPFIRPTLPELIDRVFTDLASRLPGVNTTLLRRSLAGALARADAGAVHSLYGYLDFIARQAIPDTAEDEFLLRWAAIWLPDGRKPATFATGAQAVQVSGTAGSTMPAGTQFQRSDGVVFATTQSLQLGGAPAPVSVRAIAAGAASNTAPGIELRLVQPVTGFSSTALVVAPGIAGGVDQESQQALQARLIRRIQQPPQGGSAADYETWALETPGITRAKVYPMQLGLGTVTVLVWNDDPATGFIPDPVVVAAARANIEAKRPVTAEVAVVAPTSYLITPVIAIAPDTAATRSAATAELSDLFLRDAEPGGTIPISKFRAAVSIASGVTDSRVDSPAGDIVAPTGALPRLGPITWGAI